MGWKTLLIKDSQKISLFLDNILISKGETNFKFNIQDINCILFEDYKTIITSRLINKLSSFNILVIFCDESLMPSSLNIPIKGKFDQLKVLKEQINWDKEFKTKMWEEIIKQKLDNQADVLKINKKSQEKVQLIYKYISEIRDGDITNREGHAAKVYFKELFGSKFTRDEICLENSALNYGYSIIRSAISRSIISKGLHPSISLFHHNRYDVFALSDDLMEPFRPLIDNYVYNNFLQRPYFGREEKIELINILNSKIVFKNKEMFLTNAIDLYIDSIINSFSTLDLDIIKFPYPNKFIYYEL